MTHFDSSIQQLFQQAWRISLRQPSMAGFMLQSLGHQRRAAKRRAECEAEGVLVPAVVIASITKRCNLHCKGCYARAQHRVEAEMSADDWRRILNEAEALGVSIMLIAGGEPLTRPELLEIAAEHPRMIFPLFTNGLLLDEERIAFLARHRHIIPVLSLEGHQVETDDRRGQGIYSQVLDRMATLQAAGVFFGTSVTVTRYNVDLVIGDGFVQDVLARGSKLLFTVEYVPIQQGTEPLALSDDQRLRLNQRVNAWRDELPGLFVALPGDEETYGGCLAAGRGFVHISPAGNLEPCPFAPYTDTSLLDMSLREALQSRLLRQIRESDEHLAETQGGCALWTNRAWVQSLLEPVPQMAEQPL